MLYSKNLLSRYISFNEDIETIAKQLTLKTCEVEETHSRELPTDVVIGKVLSTHKHPNADKLTVCKLDCWSKGTYQICTGAENILPEMYVAVALPGCFLPAINLTIEPRVMRGEESNGMICSKQEIGIPEDLDEHRIRCLQYKNALRTHPGNETSGHAGDFTDITDKDLGVALGEKYPWLNNRIVDVENKAITHRPDLFGHFWLAVESNALFASSITFQTITGLMETIHPGHIFQVLEHAKPGTTKIIAESPTLLSYTLLEINSITIAPSDFYMRLLMLDAGLQPRNNRVDFSNIFMLLSGQPVHFFDKKKVQGNIIIRQATAWEIFTDLFEKEHRLEEGDMVIADEHKILALAGIIGSNTSGIDETTTDVLVEIANFDAVTVRKTGTRLWLRTDAELRFEKYINPMYSLYALQLLLNELGYFGTSLWNFSIGGVQRRVNEHTSVRAQQQVTLDPDHLVSFTHGTTLGEEEANEFLKEANVLLQRIGFSSWNDRTFKVPVRRSPDDITMDADVYEEIARLYGFDRIKTQSYSTQINFVPLSKTVQQQRAFEETLRGDFQFDQLETYPRLHKQRIDSHSLNTDFLYSLKNPLSPEQKHLRHTMIRSLLEVVEKNGPFFDTLRVFDIGKTRDKRRTWSHEHTTLAFALWYKTPQSFATHPLMMAKGILEILLAPYNNDPVRYEPTTVDRFHPKQQATILCNGTPIGTVATVHPSVVESCKLPSTGQLVIAEIDCTLLHTHQETTQKTASYESLQDQIIRRDLSFVLTKDMAYGIVTETLQSLETIEAVEVFDVYQGAGLQDNQKSISVRLTLKGDGSLTTEHIQEIMKQAIDRVQTTWAVLRG